MHMHLTLGSMSNRDWNSKQCETVIAALTTSLSAWTRWCRNDRWQLHRSTTCRLRLYASEALLHNVHTLLIIVHNQNAVHVQCKRHHSFRDAGRKLHAFFVSHHIRWQFHIKTTNNSAGRRCYLNWKIKAIFWQLPWIHFVYTKTWKKS